MARELSDDYFFAKRLGKGWKGTKILGEGSFGIASLWEYQGDPIDTPSTIHIVIKEYGTQGLDNPLLESTIMRALTKCGSKHIVEQYRPAKRRWPGSEISLYLEYCPAGHLEIFLRQNSKSKAPVFILEVDLWEMFYCLALAVSVMARGTEDVESGPILHGLARKDLVHYDLKLDNIFLGYRDAQHTRYPIMKIGDFGSARWELKNQTRVQAAKNRTHGPGGWRAPESTQSTLLKNPRKGSCSNIFQIGCVMHFLLTLKDTYPATVSALFSPKYEGKFTHGSLLLEQQWEIYSGKMRGLIVECMMWEPLDRPTPVDLQRRVKAGLDAARKAAGCGEGADFEKWSMANPPAPNFGHIPLL